MLFDESCIMMIFGGFDQSKKQEFVDDFFMVCLLLFVGDDVYDFWWRLDMFVDIDIDNGQVNEKCEVFGLWELNDFCMIFECNSGEFLGNDYFIDFFVEVNVRLISNGIGQEKEDKVVLSGEKKNSGKNSEVCKFRILVRIRGEVMFKSVKKLVVVSRIMVQKNKFEKVIIYFINEELVQ